MQLRIEIIDKVPKNFGTFMDEAFRRAVLYHIEELQNNVKINLSGKILRKRNGNLLTAWSTPPRVEKNASGSYEGVLRVNSKYARIHEEPLEVGPNFGPYTAWGEEGTYIRARPENKSGLLRFQLDNGNWISTKEVRIPARRYVTKAFDVVQARSAYLTRLAVKDAARGR